MSAFKNVTVTLASIGLAAAFAAGCSVAPEGTEQTDESGSALAKCIDLPCGVTKPLPVKPPPPPPAPASCSFDGMSYASGGTHQNPGVLFGSPQAYHADRQASFCVASSSDAISTAERQLMGYGCSAPFYWESWNDNSGPNAKVSPALTGCSTNERWNCFGDEANAILQLCPMTSAVTSYVAGIPWTTYNGQPSDLAAHWAENTIVATRQMSAPGAFSDTIIPTPPAGYGWFALWEDPHACGATGCMCTI